MTVNALLTDLARRLEDSGGAVWDSDARISALNDAQDELVNMLHVSYLTELEVIDTNKTVVSGKVAFSTLSKTVIQGKSGIRRIVVYGGKECEIIPYEMWGLTQNSYFSNEFSPHASVIDENIYIHPTDTAAIDVTYIGSPTTMTAGGDCDLNQSLHTALLYFAEAICWPQTNDARGAAAYQKGINMVNALNGRVA